MTENPNEANECPVCGYKYDMITDVESGGEETVQVQGKTNICVMHAESDGLMFYHHDGGV